MKYIFHLSIMCIVSSIASENNTELAFLLGVSDFSKIVETTAFVDKTLFVKEIFNYDFILITAPDSFGKSTNMDMLKTFLEIVVDEHGHPVINVEEDFSGNLVEKPLNKLTNNFNLFKKHNLSVYQDKKFFYKHCGQIPVIHIDFKQVCGDNFEEVLDSFRTVLHNTYQQHGYLLNCTELWLTSNENVPGKFLRKAFTKFWDKIDHKNLIKTDIEFGLTFLSAVLHKYFGKKIFVLIDDLDTPIFDMIFYPSLDVHKTVEFIKRIISFLLQNAHVERALINAHTQLTTILTTSNADHFPFLYNHKFVEFFGLTGKEIENLLNKFNASNKIKDIESWYGYKILGKNVTVHRVSSIINYLHVNILKSYWSETGYFKNLKPIFINKGIQTLINKLLNFEEVAVVELKKIEVKQILCLRAITNSSSPSALVFARDNKDILDLLLQFLCDIGYFKIVNVFGEKMEITYLKLMISNKEMKQVVSHNIQVCNLMNLLNKES